MLCSHQGRRTLVEPEEHRQHSSHVPAAPSAAPANVKQKTSFEIVSVLFLKLAHTIKASKCMSLRNVDGAERAQLHSPCTVIMLHIVYTV